MRAVAELFTLWAHWHQVFQQVRHTDNAVDLDANQVLEIPTLLPHELFIVWDNLPKETKSSFATKKHLQDTFGQKDVLASFQTSSNACHRLPNKAMEVYAADICGLLKEASPW